MFTIPFIWPIQCYLGSFLIGQPLSHKLVKHLLWDAIHTPSRDAFMSLGGELLASFFAGGALLGFFLAVIGYFSTLFLVRRHRARLADRKAFRIHRWKTKGTSK